jgi:hypothetical protein
VRAGGVVDGEKGQGLVVVHPHGLGVVLEEQPVPLFRLSEGLLGPPALGDVAQDCLRGALSLEHHGRGRDLHLEAGPVLLEARDDVPLGERRRRGRAEDPGQRLAVFRSGQIENAATGPVLLAAPAEHLHGGGVREYDAPVGFRDDALPRLLEESPVAGVPLGDVPVVADVDLEQGLVARVAVGKLPTVAGAQPQPAGDEERGQEGGDRDEHREQRRVRHARRSPAPQWSPAPSAVKQTRSPGRTRPCFRAS